MAEYPHWKGLTVGLPFTGRPLPPEWAITFHSLRYPMNYNVRSIHIKGMPIDYARNEIAKYAIATKSKYLFFLDEDVTPPGSTIQQLIYHMEHHDEAAVIGGIYCLKSDNPEPMVFRHETGGGGYWKWRAGEFFEVDAIAMGCTLVRVEAFQDIPEPWFQTVDDWQKTLAGIQFAQYYTEDLWFCKQILDTKKWKIYADGSILAGHLDIETGKVYQLPPDSYPVLHLQPQKGTKRILDIGSGHNPYKSNEGDVVTLDLREDMHPDYRCDCRMLPFGNEQFDIVHSAHVLEHFPFTEHGKILDEWIRVLKPDGEFRLSVPNVRWAAERIAKGEWDKDIEDVLWGGHAYSLDVHHSGFTAERVRELFEERGFLVKESFAHYDMAFAAKRKEFAEAPQAPGEAPNDTPAPG